MGDPFCVNLALAVGAKANAEISLHNSDKKVETKVPLYRLTRSPAVRRLLRRQEWALHLVRGLDIQEQDCNNLSLIGRGEFAQVFRTSFKAFPCALKRFNAPFANIPIDYIEQLLSEMELLQQCRHPHVVQCFGVFLWDPQFPTTNPCLLLELMDISLDSLLRPGASANASILSRPDGQQMLAAIDDLSNRITIMKHVAEGLVYLHSLTPSVVHRDLKPANILLKCSPTKGVVGGGAGGKGGGFSMVAKLADFGLSRSHHAVSATLTARQSAAYSLSTKAAGAGTPSFMSPEQWRGAIKQSTKADVFSFGLTFFAVLCKVTVPWFRVEDYQDVAKGDMQLCDSVDTIRQRVDKGQWPVWPELLPTVVDGEAKVGSGRWAEGSRSHIDRFDRMCVLVCLVQKRVFFFCIFTAVTPANVITIFSCCEIHTDIRIATLIADGATNKLDGGNHPISVARGPGCARLNGPRSKESRCWLEPFTVGMRRW